MTGESRLAYHAVPCIVKVGNADEPPECLKWDENAIGDKMPLLSKRCQEKREKCCQVCEKYCDPNIVEEKLRSFSTNSEEWKPFASYLATTRININVRQVHSPHENIQLDLTSM